MRKVQWILLVAGFAMSGCVSALDGGDSPVEETQGAATNCPLPPGPSQAVFFMGDQATGSCVTLNQGSYANPSFIGLLNDSIRSVRLGSLTRAALFSDDNYGGAKTLLLQDANGLGHNASSLRVESVFDNCESSSYRPGAGAVALYKDINFHGDCVVVKNQEQDPFEYNLLGIGPLCTDIVGCPPGYFPEINVYPGLPNDSVSSAYIGPVTSAKFCRNEFFGEFNVPPSLCELMQNPNGFVQAQPNFGNTLVGNDQVTSLIVTFP